MAKKQDVLSVDVFADVACPWCYIGERRLRRAVADVQDAHPDREIVMHWRPFQLQPEMPDEGMVWQTFADEKFGGEARAEAAYRQVAAAGAGDDVDFRFDRMARAPNTVDAHRLILHGRANGREWETVDALFAAYFTHGRDLNDAGALVEVAVSAGLDEASVRALLASDRHRDDVAASQELARRLGIQGVPFYLLGGVYGVSGAQPAPVLKEALEAIFEEMAAAD